MLSVAAISLGSLLFLTRKRVRNAMQTFLPNFSLNRLYARFLAGIDKLSYLATRIQNGHLRFYLATMLSSLFALAIIFNAFPLKFLQERLSVISPVPSWIDLLGLLTLILAVLTSLVSVFLIHDLQAILALAISGLAVAIWYALEPAPDVALVQIVVDLLAMVILVLSLARLPRRQHEKANEFTSRQSRPALIRDSLVALSSGVIVTILVYVSLSTRPHISLVTPFYVENAKLLTGAKDIVGAILVDFRGFDTLFEIAVFAVAGIGIHMLLHYAARKAGDHEDPDPAPTPGSKIFTMGIGGMPTSSLLHLLANALLPLALLLAVIQTIYGHDQPGDGFTAGVFISLSIGFWYVIFGYHFTKQHLPWLRSGYLISAGLLLGIINGLLSSFFGNGFLATVNYGEMLHLPLPTGFNLGNSFLFEVSICLTVLGSATYILDNLGRPKEIDLESDTLLVSLEEYESSQEDLKID
jgi:multicomponent K+:H+ antiporter subunit A